MAQSARPYRRFRSAFPTRREWLALAAAVPLARGLEAAPALNASFDGDSIHVAAPQLRLLSDKPMERLKDGAPVLFNSLLALSFDNHTTVAVRSIERFVVSYDLWEEKFSVTRLGLARLAVAGLTVAAAEAWCLDNIMLDATRVARDRQFWLRLDVRADLSRAGAGLLDDSSLSLTRLVELFSRPVTSQQPRWTLEAGPLRLAELPRDSRRTRSG